MATEPLAYGLFRAAEHSALHMELRDSYTPGDPDWLDWQAGRRFDPAERWAELAWSCPPDSRPWRERPPRPDRLGAGDGLHQVRVRRDRRPQPRGRRRGALAPAAGSSRASWSRVRTSGSSTARLSCGTTSQEMGRGSVRSRSDDPALAKLCVSSFEAAWERAIPHTELPSQPDDRPTVPAAHPCRSRRHRLAPGKPGRLSASASGRSAKTRVSPAGRWPCYAAGTNPRFPGSSTPVTAPSADDIRSWCQNCGTPGETDDLITFLRTVEDMFVEWRRMEQHGPQARPGSRPAAVGADPDLPRLLLVADSRRGSDSPPIPTAILRAIAARREPARRHRRGRGRPGRPPAVAA